MPTYEYHCDACGHDFEEFQSITAAAIKKCPKCGKRKVRRLIGTGAGMIFKGSGFYITDYRSEGYQKDAKAASGDGGGAEKKTEGSADAKPVETKSEAKTEAKPAPDPAPKNVDKQSKSAKKK